MKQIVTTALVLFGIVAHAQSQSQGINKERPEATLNVKSKTGNITTATKNLLLENGAGTDLVTVLDNGNVGVGTATPNKKLHIVGDVNITDGTQGAGKVLTSDASGNASWQPLPTTTQPTTPTCCPSYYKKVNGTENQYQRYLSVANNQSVQVPGLVYQAPVSGRYVVKYKAFLNSGYSGEQRFNVHFKAGAFEYKDEYIWVPTHNTSRKLTETFSHVVEAKEGENIEILLSGIGVAEFGIVPGDYSRNHMEVYYIGPVQP